MNIVGVAYRIAVGLEQASCTLVGNQIGKGNPKKAYEFYQTFKMISGVILMFSTIA
jgi:Na+-driven multidrug efflux pump